MLTPKQLQGLPKPLTDSYSELSEFILRDIARRIAKAAQITDTAQYQMYRARALGLSTDEIAAEIARINGVGEKQIRRLIEQAAKTSDEFDRRMLGKEDSESVLASREQLQKLLKAQIEHTSGQCWNFTRSLGYAERNADGQVIISSLGDFMIDQMDAAHLKVMNGVTDYNTAIRQACNALAESGVRTVYYNSGRSDRIEVAVRRALMTSVSQVTQKISEQNAEEFGADGWEISAHCGARPSHAIYQGRQYPNSRYETIVKPLIEDYNCRHSAYPIIMGLTEPSYTEGELAALDPPPFVYEGRTYTAYEAQQQMRKMERAMRRQKDLCIVADAMGDTDTYTAASIRLRRQKDIYEDFCGAGGVYTEYERTFVAGYNRSLAAKTGAVTRKQRAFDKAQMRLTNGEKGGTIEYNAIRDKVAVLSDGSPALSTDVIEVVEKKLQQIPEKHRKVIENTISSIAASDIKGVSKYNPKTKILTIDPYSAEESTLHECGHILADAYDLYNDPEFISILTDGLDLSDGYCLEQEYSSVINKHWFYVKSDKFINQYQGRCYIDMDTFDYSAPIDPKCLQEYISVAFQEFFDNPVNLKNHDPKLFDYIERLMNDENQ